MAGGSDSIEKVWYDHLCDNDGLEKYSEAMERLATGPWAEQGSGRITWCVDVCEEYFRVGGALVKMIEKDLKRVEHNMPTLVPLELLPTSGSDIEKIVQGMFGSRKWKLLDVGSCYNPFKRFDKFEVTAVDIAPAHPSVLLCDFLNVDISESRIRFEHKLPGNRLHRIESGSFDIVIFSLLLSYFPSTQQRVQSCINAHKALSLHGILLIITPDSSHQNRHAGMMRSWKQCIESIGFHRWRYIKDTHLHCMAFRKTKIAVDYKTCSANHQMLYIPQDSHDDELTSFKDQRQQVLPEEPTTLQGDLTCAQLKELPFCDDRESYYSN